MKKWRGILWFGLAALGILIAFWWLNSREPRYQGQRLSVWWDAYYNASPRTPVEAEAQWAQLTNAVHSIGTNALPFYLSCLNYQPPPTWRDNLDDWLRGKTSGRIHLPQTRNRMMEAQASIEILGPAAAPAIPELARLLTNDLARGPSAMCLAAIGPPALPTLSNAVATASDPQIRQKALEGLGNMGTNAEPAFPLLLKIIQESDARADASLAGLSLRVLVEIRTNGTELMPLLVARLADTNTAPGAAFGLARLGVPGELVLLQAATNENRTIRAASAAAVDLDFGKYHRPSGPEFSLLNAAFNLRLTGYRFISYSGNEYRKLEAVLQRRAADTNEQVRLVATNALVCLRLRGSNAPPWGLPPPTNATATTSDSTP